MPFLHRESTDSLIAAYIHVCISRRQVYTCPIIHVSSINSSVFYDHARVSFMFLTGTATL